MLSFVRSLPIVAITLSLYACKGAAGVDGDPGTEGRAGVAGPAGSAGPKGDPGPVGPAGSAGPKGDPAPAIPVGVTYTRWGRTTCPGTATVVYSGYAAGGSYNQAGSGSNTLCLTDHPSWTPGQYDDTVQNGGLLYGTEYETASTGLAAMRPLQDRDAACVVCEAKAVQKLMVPGAVTCPAGWNLEYAGALMSSHYTQTKSEFLCVDAAPEVTGALNNDNGNLWYPVEPGCGALPCTTTSAIAGPYVQGREIHCAVCTK